MDKISWQIGCNSLVFIALLCFSLSLQAQSLKVTVRDANVPLAFANVCLNGHYLVSVDSTGTVGIPESMLSPGDTISSSFLGYEPAFIVYTDAVWASRAITLVHEKERVYEIEEVVVTARMDGWKAFSQFVRPARSAFVKTIGGNFEATIRMPDGSVRVVDGTFSTDNRFESNDYLYSRKSEIKVNHGDTTGLSRMLMRCFSYLKALPDGFINRLRFVHENADSERNNPYRTITYLGAQEGRRDFTFTYVSPEIRGTHQIFLSVDAESGTPRSVLAASTAATPYEVAIHSYFIEFVPHRRGMRPSGIEVDFREADGIKVEMKLTDLTPR